ncbi:MAG: PAS domain S-box protein [Promethearchaeia archaeon]
MKEITLNTNDTLKNYRRMYLNSPIAILLIDSNGIIVDCNSALEKLFNFNRDELIGKFYLDLPVFPENTFSLFRERFQKLTNMENIPPIGLKLLNANGHLISVYIITLIITINNKKYIQALIYDKNELIKMKKLLHERELRFENFINNIADILLETDLDGNILFISPQVYEVLGYTVEELIGKNIFQLIYPNDVNFVRKKKELSFEKKEKNISYECRVKHKNGTYRYLAAKGNFVKINGNYKIISVLRDLTYQKKIERKIQESERRYKNILQYLDSGFFKIDLEGNLIDYNPRFCKIFEINKEYNLKKEKFNIWNFVKNKKKFLEKIIENKKIRNYTEYAKTRYGKEIIVQINAHIINNKHNKPLKIEGTVIDITDKFRLEQELKESEEKFRTITEQSFIGIAIIQDDRIKYLNKSLAKQIGFSEEEIKKWPPKMFLNLVYPEDREKFEEVILKQNYNIKNEPRRLQFRGIDKYGRMYWLEIYSKGILYHGREALLIALLNISKQKKAEEIIRSENIKLKRLDKLRKDFINQASHELKNPLTSLYGAIQLLKRDYYKFDSQTKELLDIMENSIYRLKSLIHDLLEASRIESNKITLDLEDTNITELINEAIDNMKILLKTRNIDLKLDLENHLELKIDKKRMEHVFSNLLSNAIKNSPIGAKIEIIVKKENNIVKIIFKDNGIGLTEEEIKNLFTEFGKFHRRDINIDIIPEGTGLGLYLSKEIVELHGGKISAYSKGRNKGSKFIIELPLY